MSKSAPFYSDLSAECGEILDCHMMPLADLVARLEEQLGDCVLELATYVSTDSASPFRITHLLQTCQGAEITGGPATLTELAELPMTFNHGAGLAQDSICGYCLSFILGHTTPKKYLWGAHAAMGSAPRQLRALYNASMYLERAHRAQVSRKDNLSISKAAQVTMKLLRARSSLFGWQNNLSSQVKANSEAWLCRDLLTAVDSELASSNFRTQVPTGGHELGMALYSTHEAGYRRTDSVRAFWPDKDLVKIWPKARGASILAKAKSMANPEYSIETILYAEQPFAGEVKSRGAGGAWVLVFIPHIPEVPIAAAYLAQSAKYAAEFWISGFAILPEPLARALASGPRRYPKVESTHVADSTTKATERVDYHSDNQNIVPLGNVVPANFTKALDPQALSLGLELWASMAATEGAVAGSAPWALLAPEAFATARTLTR